MSSPLLFRVLFREAGVSIRLFAALAVLTAASAISARADTDDFMGSTASTDLDYMQNWPTNASTNAPPNSGDALLFTSTNLCTTSVLTDTLTYSTFQINGITFNAGAVGFTLTGNIFELTNTITDNATATETIDNPIVLSANQNFNPTLTTGTLYINGVVSGAYRLQADSFGTVILDGTAASTYTGITSSAGGGTLVENLTNLGAATGSPVNLVSSSSILNLGNGNGPLANTYVLVGAPTGVSKQSFLGGSPAGTQGLTLAGGVGNIVLNPNGGTSTTLVLGGSSFARNNGGVLNIDLSSTAGGLMVVSATTTSVATNGVIGYATVKDSGGYGFASLSGTNIVRLTGQTVLSATDVTASTGTTNFIDNTTGTVTLAASGTANTVTVSATSGPITINLGGASDVLALTALGLLTTGTGAVTIQNGQLGASGSELILHTMGTGGLTVSANIGAGSAALTKNGTDTLTLSGSNSYTGNSYIQEGTVRVGSTNALGNNSSVTLLPSNNVTLDLSLSNVSVGSLAGGGSVTLGGNTLTLGGNNTSTSSAAVFSGAGGITKTGTGVFTVTGTSSLTNSASINVNQGEVLLNNGNIGSAVINLGNPAAGGTASASFASTPTISNQFNVRAGTSGTLAILAGNNQTISGSVILGTGTAAQNVWFENNNGGTANFGTAVTGYGNVYILNNASTLTLNFNSSATFNNVGILTNVSTGTSSIGCSASIEGNVTEVIQNSTQQLTLSGSNTYTGDTVVTSGSLVINNANALQNSVLNFSSTNGVTITGGATENLGGLAGNGTLNLISGTGTAVNLSIGNSNLSNGSATNPNTLSPVFTGSLLESSSAPGAALTKIGANTQTLAGLATYTGATNVNGGTLIVSGSLAGTSVVNITGATMEVDGLVNNNAYTLVTGTLSGTGSVGSIAFDSSSELAPGLKASGTSAGNMTSNGVVSFEDSSDTFSIRIGVTTNGSVVNGVHNGLDNDQLTIGNGGQIYLGGVNPGDGNGPTLSLSLGAAYSSAVANGLTFIIINGGYSSANGSGIFNNGATVTASNGNIFNILYGYDPSTGMVDGNGTDVALQLQAAAIPEPAPWTLMAGGLGVFFLMRRRRLMLRRR